MLVAGKQVISSKIEFLRDMYLLFQNAFIFNPKGSDIYVMASTLKALTKTEMRVRAPSPFLSFSLSLSLFHLILIESR